MSRRTAEHTKGQGGVFKNARLLYRQFSYRNRRRHVFQPARAKKYWEAFKTLQRKLVEIAALELDERDIAVINRS